MDALRRIRKSKGLTQEELSIASHVSLKQIKSYESDFGALCRSKIATSKKIAKALCCEVEDIVPYEDIIEYERLLKEQNPNE